MQALNAFPLSEVTAVQISDGGTQMLLHAKDGHSRDVVIAIPYEHLQALLGCTAIGLQRCERAQKVAPAARVALNGGTAEVGEGELAVNLQPEGRIMFRMEEPALRALHEALHARFA